MAHERASTTSLSVGPFAILAVRQLSAIDQKASGIFTSTPLQVFSGRAGLTPAATWRITTYSLRMSAERARPVHACEGRRSLSIHAYLNQ
jgi:hypothetical protein